MATKNDARDLTRKLLRFYPDAKHITGEMIELARLVDFDPRRKWEIDEADLAPIVEADEDE